MSEHTAENDAPMPPHNYLVHTVGYADSGFCRACDWLFARGVIRGCCDLCDGLGGSCWQCQGTAHAHAYDPACNPEASEQDAPIPPTKGDE